MAISMGPIPGVKRVFFGNGISRFPDFGSVGLMKFTTFKNRIEVVSILVAMTLAATLRNPIRPVSDS